jgi:hypothetical protein
VARPTKAQAAAIAERRTKAITKRISGASWQQVADACGYKTDDHACIDFSRAMRQRLDEQGQAVDELREQEIAHLDALRAKAWAQLDTEQVLPAIDRLVRIAERRAKLTGIDSPVQVESYGSVRYEIVGLGSDAHR